MTLLYWLIGVSKCTNFMWILIFLTRIQTGRAESTALVLTSCLGQKYSQAAAQSCFDLWICSPDILRLSHGKSVMQGS
jgi:hypothetical protein